MELQVSILLDTTSRSVEQRKYLSLFCEALTESAIKLESGEILSHEQVVAELNRDFLSYSLGVGLDGGSRFKCGSYSHILAFNAQVKIGNTTWAGNVEIHQKSSEWNKHRHTTDSAYNNVVLHVVYEHDEEVL